MVDEETVPEAAVEEVAAPAEGDNLYQAGQRVEHWAYNVWDYLKLTNNRVDDQTIKHLEALEAELASFAAKVRATTHAEV